MAENKGNFFVHRPIVAMVIAIVIVIALALWFFVIDGGADARFVGRWEVETDIDIGSYTMAYIFENNGKLKIDMGSGVIPIGKWSVDGDQLCMEADASSEYYSGSVSKNCVRYSFSNDNQQLTLYQDYGEPLVLTKVI